ncbi:MAG: hypothetical protein ACFFKA_12420, partial [Candidatus Thorarchaeota archaeon]
EKARIVEMFLDQIIPKITKSIEERELMINIYKRVHPFISLTKEELICAIVCVLGVLVIERPLLPISEVCKLIGVSQGNLSRIVHQKVFSRLKISPVRRLEFASSALKTALFR